MRIIKRVEDSTTGSETIIIVSIDNFFICIIQVVLILFNFYKFVNHNLSEPQDYTYSSKTSQTIVL